MLRTLARLRLISSTMLILIGLLWAGMVVGISGLATPVKFQATSLTLPVALDVGRATFHVFNRIECGFAAALVLFGLTAGVPLRQSLAIAIVVAIVVLQTVWVLPALDLRVATTIARNPPPPSSYHLLYVLVEAIKFVVLVVIGLAGLALGDPRG